MKYTIVVTLMLSLGFGCTSVPKSASLGTYAHDINALRSVDTKEGIDKNEAYIIAKAFFWTNISGCGFPTEPEDKGQHWKSKTYIGYGGLPGAPIIIDKKSGSVSWGDKIKDLKLEELKQTKSDSSLQPMH
jgi:hypothetical protein